MEILITVVVAVVLLACLFATVSSPRIWQRLVSLLLTGVIVVVFLLVPLMSLERKRMAGDFISRNRDPTAKLWEMTRLSLVNGNFTQALKDVEFVSDKWLQVSPWPDSYGAENILEELEKTKAANQALEATPLRGSPQR